MPRRNQKEPREFISENPEIKSIDLLIADTNGVIRGKRIPTNSLEKVYKDGVCLTTSLFSLDITGDTVEETGIGLVQGDGDSICIPLPNTLKIVPWHDRPIGQLLMNMVDGQNELVFANPRTVLQNVLEKFDDLGLQPVIAVELEFYLLDPRRDKNRRPQPPLSKTTGKRANNIQVYSIDELDENADFLEDVTHAAKEQDIPVETAVAENAPGQFEINLKHEKDVLSACDNAILLKRSIKGIAKKHGMNATFMAKPYQDLAGNGMHIHLSLLDKKGKNVFSASSSTSGSQKLHHAIGGLTNLMDGSMALFCPNANSYRRFQPDLFVAMSPTWGVDNRTVAIRIPLSNDKNTRLEHRIAGADANPYLVTAALLAGVHNGLTNKIKPPKISTGDATKNVKRSLSTNLNDSIRAFNKSSIMKKYLGKDFCKHYVILKTIENARFEKHVTPLELDWLLRTV